VGYQGTVMAVVPSYDMFVVVTTVSRGGCSNLIDGKNGGLNGER